MQLEARGSGDCTSIEIHVRRLGNVCAMLPKMPDKFKSCRGLGLRDKVKSYAFDVTMYGSAWACTWCHVAVCMPVVKEITWSV